ncbi:MAG: ATP-binding protein [Cyanobacteriota bacterium]|nr:ATP-binding protein [Cyanobacteriota bacterium]
MVTSPLRCHLLIGPPASGKSTLAAVLAERTGAIVLSTDAIRAELFGDAAVQGAWSEIEAVFHQRLKDAVAAGQPVILDATHSQRPFRLAITQALDLPQPVQWIGWWLTTPLEQCLAWNRQRQRQVPEEVIRRQFAQLLDRSKIRTSRLVIQAGQDPVVPVGPDGQSNRFIDRQRSHFREEGFATVVAIDPAAINGTLRDQIDGAVGGLDRAIQMAGSRKAKVVMHRYSRLLDLERLIFLIRLLLEFPGVELADPAVEQELRASFLFEPSAPLPDDEELSFASRAAYALHHRHGPCYGDKNAVEKDLWWLLRQKFVSLADLPVSGPVIPGEACERVLQMKAVGAGFPAAADEPVFQRQFGLLRHLIQNPFDHPTGRSGSDHVNSHFLGHESVKPLEEVVREARKLNETASQGVQNREGATNSQNQRPSRVAIPSLRAFLLTRLSHLNVADYGSLRRGYGGWDFQPEAPQLRTLDKDIELLIKGYGFTTIKHGNHGQL